MALMPSMQKSLNYWRSLPIIDGASLPHRAEFDPDKGIDSHQRVSLMRYSAPYTLEAELVRLASCNAWERSIAGINAFDLASPDMRENLSKLCKAILKHPCGAVVTQQISDTNSRSSSSERSISTLYLPLLDHDGASSIILGLTSSPTPGLQPNLRNQLIVAHSQFKCLDFIDLGAGIPTVCFDAPSVPRPIKQSHRNSWWQRFIPNYGTSSARRADLIRDPSGLDAKASPAESQQAPHQPL